MESNKLKFANDLNIGVDWEDNDGKVTAVFDNSNDFSNAVSRLEKVSSVEEIDEEGDINLSGARFIWKGYSNNDEIYTVQAIGDFINDTYKIEIE